LQVLVADKQTAATREMCKATEGLRRAAVWLTIATFIMALGTLGPLIIALFIRLHLL
jgi:hypothetical protein